MNSIIKKQLEKVKATKISFNDNTTKIYIKKVDKVDNKALKIGDICKIKFEDFILSNKVLASNWNNGIIPKSRVYKVEVVDIMANYIKFNGVSENDVSDGLFNFWSPLDGFEVIEYGE